MEWEAAYERLIERHIAASKGERRGKLQRGLGHGEKEFLQHVWFPAVGHFDDLYLLWEIRDRNGKVRYLDIAYRPGGLKGMVEVQGYGPHARDIPRSRFKDASLRHCYLVLDGWTVLPIAYDLVRDNPRLCQQFVLAFIGKFVSDPQDVPQGLDWLESEVLRYARRSLRPFTPGEVRGHLNKSGRYVRDVLHRMVDKGILVVASGKERARTYMLKS